MNTVARPISAELARPIAATSSVMSYVPRDVVATVSTPRWSMQLRYAEERSVSLQRQLATAYRSKDLFARGLRQRLREGYTIKDFRADLLSALVVGVVVLL